MTQILAQYALFLAKTVTVVGAGLLAVAVLAVAARRARHRPQLEVTDLGRRYDELAWTLRRHLLPRRILKRQLRADRRRRRATVKAEGKMLEMALKAQAAGSTPGSGPGSGPASSSASSSASSPASSSGERALSIGRARVFVLDFHGDLRATGVTALRHEVTAVLEVATPRDEVLVRLENSGGLVNSQGLAASQLLRVRQRGIPLTVAVDSVAASGGYMMACVADRIVAAPFAVIGSIGVITELLNVNRLLERQGVDVEQFKGGESKRTVTVFGRTTDEDREKLAGQIEDTHLLFKEFVAQNRPQVDLDEVATGAYWYGTRALDLHLIDELTTSDDYLLAARERADLYQIRFGHRKPAQGRLIPALRSLAVRLLQSRLVGQPATASE